MLGDFAIKVKWLETELGKIMPKLKMPECFPSPLEFYRARMEFSVHRVENFQLCYVMFDREKKAHYLKTSSVPLRCISDRMPLLLKYLEENEPILSQRLFQINWRADLAGQVLLTLLYHYNLNSEDSTWYRAAERLAPVLHLNGVVGRSKNRLLHVGSPFLESSFLLEDGLALSMKQNDTCFSQPNAYSNLNILYWARQHFYSADSDLLELYCGIGNFTCALASGFRKIFATEVVRNSLSLCRENILRNGLENVAVARLSAAETAEAITGVRAFQRLAKISLADYQFTHLLLDPPRGGLDEFCRCFAMNFTHILYISCNPTELLHDLAFWREQGRYYRIVDWAVFDQFPNTTHLEVGVCLEYIS